MQTDYYILYMYNYNPNAYYVNARPRRFLGSSFLMADPYAVPVNRPGQQIIYGQPMPGNNQMQMPQQPRQPQQINAVEGILI